MIPAKTRVMGTTLCVSPKMQYSFSTDHSYPGRLIFNRFSMARSSEATTHSVTSTSQSFAMLGGLALPKAVRNNRTRTDHVLPAGWRT